MDIMDTLKTLVDKAIPLAERLFDCPDTDLAMAEDAVRTATRLRRGFGPDAATAALDLFTALTFGASEFSHDEMATITEGLFLANIAVDTQAYA